MSKPLRRSSLLIVLVCMAVVAVVVGVRYAHDDSRRHYLGTDAWPTHGQASFAIDGGAARSSPGQHPAPIASLAKVMTAYLVLQRGPLHPGRVGFRMTVTERDVVDTLRRMRRDESVVAVRAGELLTERQALAALLLPSANNVAVMLARLVSGSVHAFVRDMNRTARAFGMHDTTYTDPSGFDDGTRSTAGDQLILARVAMQNPTFADMVAKSSYRLPVAGIAHNTDQLLGTGGFVGIKTGSDDAAGGCFMFRAHRILAGNRVDVTGVVLGQPGHDLITTGQYAARQLVDTVAAPSS